MAREQFDKTCCFFKGLKNKCRQKRKRGRRSCPLNESHCNGKVKVCAVTGDRKTCARMAHLGFLPGQEVELICKSNRNQCLVKVNGGTISLDHITAENILVAPV